MKQFTILTCVFFLTTLPSHAENLIQTFDIDLNGDGIIEHIEVEYVEDTDEQMRSYYDADFYYSGNYIVRINDQEVTGWSEVPEAAEIVDIDENDGRMELLLADDGPSNETNCIIYGWNGEEIYTVGEFYGSREFDGHGTIYSGVSQEFWTATFIDRLNPDTHTLYTVPQDLYFVDNCCNQIIDNGCMYTVTVAFPLYKDASGSQIIENLEPGSEITFIAAKPNVNYENYDTWEFFEWYLLRTDDNVLGWIDFWTFYDKLEGLCQAD